MINNDELQTGSLCCHTNQFRRLGRRLFGSNIPIVQLRKESNEGPSLCNNTNNYKSTVNQERSRFESGKYNSKLCNSLYIFQILYKISLDLVHSVLCILCMLHLWIASAKLYFCPIPATFPFHSSIYTFKS